MDPELQTLTIPRQKENLPQQKKGWGGKYDPAKKRTSGVEVMEMEWQRELEERERFFQVSIC